jgi:hypothetical protein
VGWLWCVGVEACTDSVRRWYVAVRAERSRSRLRSMSCRIEQRDVSDEDEEGCHKSYKKLPSCVSMVSPTEEVIGFDGEERGTKRKMRVVQGMNWTGPETDGSDNVLNFLRLGNT